MLTPEEKKARRIEIATQNLIPCQPGEVRNPEGHNGHTHPKVKYKSNLPPIVIDKDGIPFPVSSVTNKDDIHKYWQRQGPKVLQWATKRIWQFIVYQEQGVHDPLGEMMFTVYFKQLVKDAGIKPEPPKLEELEQPASLDNSEGNVKKWRKMLMSQLNDLQAKPTPIEEVEEVEDVDPVTLAAPGISSMPDEFKK